MNREYHKWFSVVLQREIELLVFGDRGSPVLFFPTRTARFFDYENWGVVKALQEKIGQGQLQLFCVDSADAESFYNANIHPAERIKRHLEYEQYIIGEVLPFISARNTNGIVVAGCSMGAYHAVNLVLKYPQKFIKVVAMSGRYDLTRSIENFRDLFDGYKDEMIYYNMPSYFMKSLDDKTILSAIRKVEIILAIGETDPFFANNVELSNMLSAKGIDNQLYVWEGEAHRPRHWQKMVQLYL